MALRNTAAQYGWMSLALHWLMALGIFAMYGLGLWIDELDYYDALYQTLPHIHESIGIVLAGILAFRLAWRLIERAPDDTDLKPLERRAAHLMHWAFYAVIAAVAVSGYLISTADGRPLAVFDWFQVSATISGPHQEDLAGEVHEWLANLVMAMAALHGAAALKHHYWDGGRSLRRMLPPSRKSTDH